MPRPHFLSIIRRSSQSKSDQSSLVSSQSKSDQSSLVSSQSKSDQSSLVSSQSKSDQSSLVSSQSKSDQSSLDSSQSKSDQSSLDRYYNALRMRTPFHSLPIAKVPMQLCTSHILDDETSIQQICVLEAKNKS